MYINNDKKYFFDLRAYINNEISDLKYGVIWNIKVNSGNFDSTLNSILETNILFNPLSYECYRIR